jgi:hypothetical protein
VDNAFRTLTGTVAMTSTAYGWSKSGLYRTLASTMTLDISAGMSALEKPLALWM